LHKHHLRLLLDEPSVRYDQPSGFQREMSQEMVAFLRQNIHPQPKDPASGPATQDISGEDRCLLVLDYENLLLQLGQEGYFLSSEEIRRKLTALLKEVRERYAGRRVEALAVGHWNRPDQLPAAQLLKGYTYTLLSVDSQATSSGVLQWELHERLQSARLPKNILLVAPHQEFAPFVAEFEAQGHAVDSWVNDNEDSYIYQAITQSKMLAAILKLSGAQRLMPEELEVTQAACILRLDHSIMVSASHKLSLEECPSILQQVTSTQGQTDWWRLWLLNKQILIPELTNTHASVTLNSRHPAVVAVAQKRTAIVLAMVSSAQENQGVSEESLVRELRRHPAFSSREENIISFLPLLQEEDILSIDSRPVSSGGSPIWQLNTRHPVVIALTADRLLPFFVLGLDHAIVQMGKPALHEHALRGRLRNYVEYDAVETVYRLARERGWVQRQEMNSPNASSVTGVVPALDAEETRKLLLNRDILFSVLYRRGRGSGMQRDALWTELKNIRRFTLMRNEFDQWLTLFQRDSLIKLVPDINNTERDCIQLRLDMRSVQDLLGRMELYYVVLVLRRILHATSPEAGKPEDEVVGNLARRFTHGDKQIAKWAIEYAKEIRMVRTTDARAAGIPAGLLFLHFRHPIVEDLDKREDDVCRGLVELVRMLSKPHLQNGYVPQHIIMSEMAKQSRFGYVQGEYEYWLNQAIHRHKLLSTKIESGHPPKTLICLSSENR